jgi:cytochrome c oxidase subunit 2
MPPDNTKRRFVLTGHLLMVLSIMFSACLAGFTPVSIQTREYNSEGSGVYVETPKSPDHPGLVILREKGCLVCHSIDGSRLVGPTFKMYYGSERTEVTPGGVKKEIADSAHIKRAIYYPDEEMALGYGKSLMKSYKDILSDAEVRTIIEYLKTLSGKDN